MERYIYTITSNFGQPTWCMYLHESRAVSREWWWLTLSSTFRENKQANVKGSQDMRGKGGV